MPTPEPVTLDAPPMGGPVMMTQAWRDVTFLHWRVDPAQVAPMLPPGVHPDVHDGATHVGLVPFRMVDAGVAGGPAVPFFGTFLETNIRVYTVDDTGRRGIVFSSLDASRAAVVVGARAAFGLPYRWARMAFDDDGEQVTYRAVTRRAGHRSVIRVRPGDPVVPDPLLAFLTARWALHERHGSVTWSVPNAHERWPLHDAEVTHLDDDLLTAAGFGSLAARPPDLAHFSPGVAVRFGWPRPHTRGR